MIRQNLHTHTTWDDGKNTAREMIEAALAAGMTAVGISVHSPTEPADGWSLPAEKLPDYRREMAALAREYAGRIRVCCGVEWDVTSSIALAPFDYVIGSVHYLPIEGHPTVDDSEAVTERFLSEVFHGDADAAAAMYFGELERVAREPEVDIVGHFDLLTKFDERRHFFNPDSPVYRRSAERAMEALVAAGKIFEVNTGAISRGYRKAPYPSRALLTRLCQMGGHVTVSADAHAASGIACAFDEAEALLRACGFREIYALGESGFAPAPLG